MLIEGKFVVKVPIEKAWNILLSPETLASCIPGCEKMEAVDEKTYACVIKQKVGPISVRFKFTTTLTEVNSPIFLKMVGTGADIGKAGLFSQETTVNLKEFAENETVVSYQSEVRIVGRLATFGDRIIRAKAEQVGREFTQNLNKRISG
jgi:carbon monoxide dehydrogenase subunit G